MHSKGSDHPSYIDGRSLVDKHCCDCGKSIQYLYERCHSCAARYFQSKPEFKEGLKIRLSGSGNPMFGKKQSLEARKKISVKSGGTGNLDDKNRYKYGSGFTESLKENIRSRDSYECKTCSLNNQEHLLIYDCSLAIHHIDYNKNNHQEFNLVSLCFRCHAKTNFNRPYWKDLFRVNLFPSKPKL